MARKRSIRPTLFGGLLRRHRLALDLSQAALASRAGISSSLVALLELGERQPRRDKVAAIALALRLGPRESKQLMLRAGFAPSVVSGHGIGLDADPSPAVRALEGLLSDSRLTRKHRILAESLLEAFAKWLRDALAKGDLVGVKSK